METWIAAFSALRLTDLPAWHRLAASLDPLDPALEEPRAGLDFLLSLNWQTLARDVGLALAFSAQSTQRRLDDGQPSSPTFRLPRRVGEANDSGFSLDGLCEALLATPPGDGAFGEENGDDRPRRLLASRRDREPSSSLTLSAGKHHQTSATASSNESQDSDGLDGDSSSDEEKEVNQQPVRRSCTMRRPEGWQPPPYAIRAS